MPADIDDPNGSIDGILTALCNKRRRMLIRLVSVEPQCPRAAAEQIAAIEQESPTATDRHAVYVVLKQTHIPACEDENILDYDQQTDTLRPGSAFEMAHEILECIEEVLS